MAERENFSIMRPTYPVTELLGDGIGDELSRAVHRLAEALPIGLEFRAVDFSLGNRRRNQRTIYDEAVEAVTATKVGAQVSDRRRPRRAPTRSSGGGWTCRSSIAPSTRSPASRPTSAASSTWTSSGSRPAGPTTIPAG